MTSKRFGVRGKRFWVRDDLDGGWGEFDTREEAEAFIASRTDHEREVYDLRVDDMED